MTETQSLCNIQRSSNNPKVSENDKHKCGGFISVNDIRNEFGRLVAVTNNSCKSLTSHFKSGKVSLEISGPGLDIGWTIIIVSPVE